MLFKLSVKNMKKSIKDYAIYFLTLVLGVAIFYMFNSLDSQQAMLEVSSSTRDMIQLMIQVLGMLSVFIAIVLGLLIVYANNFLINRRKKEFGIYMTLGMGKRQISKIILFETILVGILSLVAGLFIGIFATQFMSVFIAKLFEADMTEFKFVFSSEAAIKTCVYFAVMYIIVMIFNTFTISRYKLINLLTKAKKNEKIRIKNLGLCILVFLIAVVMLAFAYYKVTIDADSILTEEKMLQIIIIGTIATVLVFWSVSGFILRLIQLNKKIYLKDTNMFVLRQLHNKINTTVVSMSVICLMLFMTISVLSSSLALKNNMEQGLIEMTPVDINLYKTANLPDIYEDWYTGETKKYNEEKVKDSKELVSYTLKNNGFDMNNLKDVIEFPTYAIEGIDWKYSLGDYYTEAKKEFPSLAYHFEEQIMKISDYNKVAKLYGIKQYELNDDQYIVLCNFDSMVDLRNEGLKVKKTMEIGGKEYHAKYDTCQEGFIFMSSSHTNTGIILVPDSTNLKDEWKEQYVLIANYNAKTEEEKARIDAIFQGTDTGESQLIQNLDSKEIELDGMTKTSIIESSKGVAAVVVFIAIYLGVIFLIASSAILALKQLTESSDNKQRYSILRKIGCDEKMINSALFKQIAIFFMLPLILAIIHSVFGIQFAMKLMAVVAEPEELLPSIIVTAIVIGLIYGLYFLATYLGSKNIIKEEG